MRKRRRALSLVLALVLCMGMLALPVGAASDEAVNAAEELYARGLFKGTATVFRSLILTVPQRAMRL